MSSRAGFLANCLVPTSIAAQDNEQCTICQDSLVGPAVVIPCNHAFHRQCLVNWVTQPGVNSCPTCRYDLFTLAPGDVREVDMDDMVQDTDDDASEDDADSEPEEDPNDLDHYLLHNAHVDRALRASGLWDNDEEYFEFYSVDMTTVANIRASSAHAVRYLREARLPIELRDPCIRRTRALVRVRAIAGNFVAMANLIEYLAMEEGRSWGHEAHWEWDAIMKGLWQCLRQLSPHPQSSADLFRDLYRALWDYCGPELTMRSRFFEHWEPQNAVGHSADLWMMIEYLTCRCALAYSEYQSRRSNGTTAGPSGRR